MKLILRLISLVTLLTAVGCIFPGPRGGDYREGERHRGRGEYRREEFRGHEERHPEPGVDVRIHAD
jgi:hypothetical protein